MALSFFASTTAAKMPMEALADMARMRASTRRHFPRPLRLVSQVHRQTADQSSGKRMFRKFPRQFIRQVAGLDGTGAESVETGNFRGVFESRHEDPGNASPRILAGLSVEIGIKRRLAAGKRRPIMMTSERLNRWRALLAHLSVRPRYHVMASRIALLGSGGFKIASKNKSRSRSPRMILSCSRMTFSAASIALVRTKSDTDLQE